MFRSHNTTTFSLTLYLPSFHLFNLSFLSPFRILQLLLYMSSLLPQILLCCLTSPFLYGRRRGEYRRQEQQKKKAKENHRPRTNTIPWTEYYEKNADRTYMDIISQFFVLFFGTFSKKLKLGKHSMERTKHYETKCDIISLPIISTFLSFFHSYNRTTFTSFT